MSVHRPRKSQYMYFFKGKTLSFLKLHSRECRRHMWRYCASAEDSFFFNLKLPVFTRLRRIEGNSEGEEIILYKVRGKGDANHNPARRIHITVEENQLPVQLKLKFMT